MKHILFPTVADADAFIADLQNQGAVQSQVGTATLSRRSAATGTGMTDTNTMTNTTTTTTAGDYADDGTVAGGTAEDAGAGAIKGTGVGLLAGAAAGVLGAGAVAATGGLALPVILGMAALGSGVGAAVGGIGGAAGVDETGDRYDATNSDRYTTSDTVDDHYYDHLNNSTNNGGRAVAVDDNVAADVLNAAMSRHNGQFVSAESIGASSNNI